MAIKSKTTLVLWIEKNKQEYNKRKLIDGEVFIRQRKNDIGEITFEFIDAEDIYVL